MTVTKKAIRQAVAALMPEAYVGTATTTSETTVLFDEDDEIMSFVADGGRDYTGFWLVRPDAADSTDRVRRVSAHDPGLGSLTPSRAWTNAPDSETYELWPPHLRPTIVDNAIDDGLERLTYKVVETFSPTANQNSYALASYTWINTERDVREVYSVYTSGSIISRVEYPWWKVIEDAGTFTLYIDPTPSTATGLSVEVVGVAHYTSLANDAATTACQQDWAVSAAFVELLRILLRTQKGFNAEAWRLDYAEAKKLLYRLSRKYRPSVPRRVMNRTPFSVPRVGG